MKVKRKLLRKKQHTLLRVGLCSLREWERVSHTTCSSGERRGVINLSASALYPILFGSQVISQKISKKLFFHLLIVWELQRCLERNHNSKR